MLWGRGSSRRAGLRSLLSTDKRRRSARRPQPKLSSYMPGLIPASQHRIVLVFSVNSRRLYTVKPLGNRSCMPRPSRPDSSIAHQPRRSLDQTARVNALRRMLAARKAAGGVHYGLTFAKPPSASNEFEMYPRWRPGMDKPRSSLPPYSRAGLSDLLGPYPFVAQPHRSIRVGLAFCQLEIALRELARETGDAIT